MKASCCARTGTDWEVVQAKQIPFVGLLTRATAQASAAQPAVKVDLTAASNDPTGLNLFFDSANKTFVAPRAGRYLVNVYVYQT